MLNIRCGIKGPTTTHSLPCDWPVMRAEAGSKFLQQDLLNSLSQPKQLHIFASPMAFLFFQDALNSLDQGVRKQIPPNEMLACGVGNTTDTLARSLKNPASPVRWSDPALSSPDNRENGLAWTLEQLEKKGLVPRHPLHLWTKSFSSSEKILRDVKTSRQWNMWETSVHEIYGLKLNNEPFPPEIILALANRTPVCFGVKSAEVLDATVALLLLHTRLTSAQQLPRTVHFSVWEKGALQKAQQLFLHSRLIPWSSFEQHPDLIAES